MIATPAILLFALAIAAMVPGATRAGGMAVCEWDRGTRLQVCLEDPTDRYGHNVLGEHSEWMGLSFGVAGDGRSPRTTVLATRLLPEDRVFEDVAPRLADLDRRGPPEIVVVEASRGGGAEIAVYRFRPAGAKGPGELDRVAATPPIGRSFRWRAVAGIADLDGDGTVEIAEVVTPHIGGTLRIWSWRVDALTEIASAAGFSNHRIGEDFVTSAVRHCDGGAELVLPDFGWTELYGVRLSDGVLSRRALGLPADRDGIARALNCEAS